MYTGFLYFTKLRKFIMTTNFIITCSDKSPVKDTHVRGRMFMYSQLEGITLSLIKGQTNFILHFTNMASIEMFSPYRKEIVDAI